MEEEEAVFEFETVLGEGSFGTVYLIRDKEDRQYAVKRINFQGQESERTQALREAELLSKVRHEHILNYIESFEDDECLNIVTEYCDGGDLEVYLRSRNGKSLPEVRVCHWIYQIASGLQHLHDQKILHRDLKAKNIFMMCDLSLKLGDLGIAKLLELNQSKAESFVGTPAYMSPELFKNVPYNHKSDIWSFGCCCYEMVALEKAFQYDSLPALFQMVCSGERPPFPANYSDSLKCIVYSMLDQEPDCRPSATHIVSNVYIRKRLAEPIDKSNSQDRHNKNQQSKGKERESKTQSAKERREKAEKKYQTMSHAWLTIKHEISTYRLENQRKSVKRTMEQMKKLKLRSVKQGNDDTDMCTYGNHSDTADFNGDNTDDESTLIIDFVQISNSREDRIGDTESQTSYLEDDVFGVKKHEERSTVYQDQAGELIMREQLPPYQYNRAPFLVRRQKLDPILRDSSSNNKGTQKTKKKRIFRKFEEPIIEDMESELVVPNTSNSQRMENLVKAVFRRGKWENPKEFDTWTHPRKIESLKMKLYDKDNSDIPSDPKKLDETLPVVPVDFEKLKNPDPKSIQILWIGHATVFVQMEGVNILCDPLFSERCSPTFKVAGVELLKHFGYKRYRPVPCKIRDLPRVDVVLISHDHYDHLDTESIMEVKEKFPKAKYYVPMGLKEWFTSCGCVEANIEERQWWEEIQHPLPGQKNQNLTFACTPAQHWCTRNGMLDQNKRLWCSWAVKGPTHSFYFGGDTGYNKIAFHQIGKKYGPFSLSALPIGAYEPRWYMCPQHVSPEESVEIHKEIRSKFTLGVHWGTFKQMGCFEPYLEPPELVAKHLEELKLPARSFRTIHHGEIWTISQEEINT